MLCLLCQQLYQDVYEHRKTRVSENEPTDEARGVVQALQAHVLGDFKQIA